MLAKKKPIVLCLMGPTASGKTDLAIALAQAFPIEIINVDSAQIYQGLDIGSGKPALSIRQQIPHHLMDFLDPALAYSAAQFCQDAKEIIADILQRNKLPVLVGGTMLYFKALQQGLSVLPNADPSLREQLTQQAQIQGWLALHQQLQNIDPVSASQIRPSDPHRILRALEIYYLTGKPKSYWVSQPREEVSPFKFINISVEPIISPRAELHQRIAVRFNAMLEQGFVQEVAKLQARGDLKPTLPAIRAVGYRQIWQYLLGEISEENMKANVIAATRQLAKRQLTWLRHWQDVMRFDFQAEQLVTEVVQTMKKFTCF